MAYLRPGEKLSSGKISHSYIIGALKGIVNIGTGNFLPYRDLKEIMENSPSFILKKRLGDRLYVHGEELELFCERLTRKYDSGEIWIAI